MTEKEVVNEVRPESQAAASSEDKFSSLVSQALQELANRDTVAGAAASAITGAISKAAESMYCCHFTDPERDEHEQEHSSKNDLFMCLHREEPDTSSNPRDKWFNCRAEEGSTKTIGWYSCLAHAGDTKDLGWYNCTAQIGEKPDSIEHYNCTAQIENTEKETPRFDCAHIINPPGFKKLPPEMFACTHRIEPGEVPKPPTMFACASIIKPGEHSKPPEMFACTHRIEPDEQKKPPQLFACANQIKPEKYIPKDMFQCAHRENNNV